MATLVSRVKKVDVITLFIYLPDFFISSRHPLGVQGRIQSARSPRDNLPAFSWCKL